MENSTHNFLLVSLNNLGDCIMFLPVAATLRADCPAARITLLTGRPGAEAADVTGLFDEIIIPRRSPRDRKVKHRASLVRLIPRIRRRAFNVAIMASGESSYVCAALFLARIKRRIGFDDCKLRFLLTDRVVARKRENEARRNARLLAPMGLPADVRRPPWHLPESIVDESIRRLHNAGVPQRRDVPRVLVHPGSAVPNRRWPPRKYALLCSRLLEDKLAQPVLLEGPSEPGLAALVRQEAGREIPILADLDTISLLAGVMLHTDLFLGHSTGTFHVACLIGRPTVTLWGVSDPEVWGAPWENERHLIIRSPATCDPDDDAARRNEILPCMEAISVDTVLQAVVRQLGEHRSKC